MFKRNKLAMLVAEFLGTGILTLVILSVLRSQLSLAYFWSIAAGLAVVALTYVFGRISGAHLNPALTIGLWTARRIRTPAALLYVVVQVLGAWAAYGLYHYFINSPTAAAAATTTAANATTIQAIVQPFSGRVMVAEAIGTMVFALAWASAAYSKLETPKFAIVAGLGYVLAIMIAAAAAVGLANPAVAVGVRAWEVFGSNGWGNYFLGPVLGAVIGVNLYGLLFADSDSRVALFRRRKAMVVAPSSVSSKSNTALDEDLDDDTDLDDDIDAENAKIDIDKAINKNAKTVGVAPRSAVKVTKSKKSTAKKVAAKKKR